MTKKLLAYLFFLGIGFTTQAQTGFLENKGQVHSDVLYEAAFHTQKIYLNQDGFRVLLHNNEKWAEWMEEFHEYRESKSTIAIARKKKMEFQAIQFGFKNANFSRPSELRTLPATYNYFLGKDQSKWAHNARKHQKIIFENIYPNIDVEFETIDQRFKYNFILKPGADINLIELDIQGADAVSVQNNQLVITHRFGDFREVMPLCYFSNAGEIEPISMAYYQTKSGTIKFQSNQVDASQTTVIDPELIFSTYSGSTVDNFGFTATYDKYGNLYAGGIAAEPSNLIPFGRYPATIGAFDQTFNGGAGLEPANLACDVSISKYDPTGATLLYATYLGGVNDEYPHSMIADSANNLIIYGTTYSNNFPTIFGCPQPLKDIGVDLFVCKISEDGSALMGSTYLGGDGKDGLNQSGGLRYFYADDFRGEVNIDSVGNIFVATTTTSDDFPVTTGAFQSTRGGGQDGVVFSLNSDITDLRWSTYFGGSSDDAVYTVDVRKDGKLYISGGTRSTDLTQTNGGYQPAYAGGLADGFVSLLDADGRNVQQTSYFGTTRYDQILSLDLDKYGNVFVVGQSEGDIPVKGDVQFKVDGKQFITKFDPTLVDVLLSTVYGSGRTRPDITVNAFLVDECGKIFISGWGGSLYTGPTLPLKDMPLTNDAVQKTTDGNDFHLAVFSRDAKEILYATYFGGNLTDDHVDGGTSRFDKKGVIYQSVCSSCPPSSNGLNSRVSDFPTTSGAYAETNPSPRCSNASFKLSFGNLNRKPQLQEEIYYVRALDEIDFTYVVTDPDEDTINVYPDYPTYARPYFKDLQFSYVDKAIVEAEFSFAPPCDLIGDTIEIPIHAVDIGCPGSKDSNSIIRIVVEPPPVIDPPEVLCLNFTGQNEITLAWEESESSIYFKTLHLYKVNPNGDTSIVGSYSTQEAGTYIDANVVNPRERDYTYFIRIENRCDAFGPYSYLLSTVKEHEVPVDSTYLATVTVEDQHLKVVWLRSTEDDFGHYEIYKAIRGKGEPVYLTSVSDINDTVFIDNDVNVNTTSYCYQIRVSDDCGHLSVLTNYGCSIVIRGESVDDGKNADPRFAFDLYWDEYLSWKGSVQEYELLRANDESVLAPIVSTDALTRAHRNNLGPLDYDWGGYWFSVIAYEGPGSQNAQSRSNDIYLIQPPLVYVPNAVTANRDNLNDVFSWSDVFVKDFEMRVYNRWGEKVFESKDKNEDWTGVFNDQDLPWSNVYFWIVTYKGWDNFQHTANGTVTFVK